jgi:hypothetical protein
MSEGAEGLRSSEIEDDLSFVAKARGAIAAGFTVFYTSWL